MEKQNISIKIPKKEIKIPIFKIKFGKDLPQSEINKEENIFLKYYKNKIDEIPNNKHWDNVKKLTNEYELIHLSRNKKYNESIAFYNPLSRSYFKMIEFIMDFNLFQNFNCSIMKTAHIAEGPGGFIEAIVNKRKNFKDDINTITLQSTKKEVPGWRKTKLFLEKYPNIKIYYGEDGTGDIYKIENIKNFQQKVGFNSCELVTSDGGFDFSIDFNRQEQMSSRLIFCEIVTALSVQKINGCFICKFFDTYTNITIQMLWLLNNLYEETIITKPFSSRPANSEKYIVARGFKGITPEYLDKLFNTVKKWEGIENTGNYVYSLFNDEYLNYQFTEIIRIHNIFNTSQQIQVIKKTLDIILDNIQVEEKKIIEKQIVNALEWCKKYNVDINFNSPYLHNIDNYKQYINITKYEKWIDKKL